MKLKSMSMLVGVVALTISLTPAQVRAEESNLSGRVADSTQRLDLTTQQPVLSRMNLSSDQEAQLQQIKQPSTFQVIKPILTSGQYQMWLQMRRGDFGGR